MIILMSKITGNPLSKKFKNYKIKVMSKTAKEIMNSISFVLSIFLLVIATVVFIKGDIERATFYLLSSMFLKQNQL